ncbi:MAG: hypothetical protein NZO16_02560 [Deltaproteobacteria bacterium]|nr:hypothetical protein [Deltaproteobacteria bacterium]
MRVLVRELTKDGQELNLNQDVIGDKLPGIRYSFNSLEVALEDFLGSFKINVEPTAKELIVKPEYVCHKPSVKRLGKFLLLFARPAFEHIRGESTRYAIEIN